MRYPTTGKNPRNAVSVPAISGGVNLADALNLVDDNQMTECQNVWYKNGFLQTKPGQELDTVKGDGSDRFFFFDGDEGGSKLVPYFSTNEVYVDDVKYKVLWILKGQGARIYLVSPSQVFLTKNLSITKKNFSSEMQFDNFNFNFQSLAFYNDKPTLANGKGLYAYATFEGDYVFLFELVEDGETYSFSFIDSDNLYIPTIQLNGKGAYYSELPANVQTEYAASTHFEGLNAISNSWEEYCFTTDGVSPQFVMPKKIENYNIKFEYTDPTNGVVYSTGMFDVSGDNFDGDSSNTNVPPDDTTAGFRKFTNQTFSGFVRKGDNFEEVSNVSVFITIPPKEFGVTTRKNIYFWALNPNYSEGGTEVRWLFFCFKSALGLLANNLKIKIKPMPNTFKNKTAPKSKFPRMTIADSFGSASEGVSGGNRTFLAGSSGAKKSLLAWSDIDEPTFFPENNYVYVGDSTQKINALKKQDNMLVIYKTNETFYTVEMEGTSYTSEDIKMGKVVDVTTLDSTFPIIQISPDIGCDRPHSVQLCGNRLVWAHRNKIYMLRSANQYSNVNVSVISNMLGNIELSPNSSGATHDGYYFLHSTNTIYVLNYDQYYFNSLPSYSDAKKSNRKLQWHIWKTPPKGDGKTIMISDYDNFGFCSALVLDNGKEENSEGYLSVVKPVMWLFNEDYANDDKISIKIVENNEKEITTTAEPIESVVQTKMFDFGAMDRFKSIEQMYVEFGKCESDVNVQYLTEHGRLNELRVNLDDTTGERSAEFIKTKRFLPGIKRAIRFGLKLSSTGKIKISGILIKFKYMGVTR